MSNRGLIRVCEKFWVHKIPVMENYQNNKYINYTESENSETDNSKLSSCQSDKQQLHYRFSISVKSKDGNMFKMNRCPPHL